MITPQTIFQNANLNVKVIHFKYLIFLLDISTDFIDQANTKVKLFKQKNIILTYGLEKNGLHWYTYFLDLQNIWNSIKIENTYF